MRGNTPVHPHLIFCNCNMLNWASLIARSRAILADKGPGQLVRDGITFAMTCLIRVQRYDLYQVPTDRAFRFTEADFKPHIEDLTIKIISANGEADRLEGEGFGFRSLIPNARERLDSGAIAFCTFVRHELAHIGWVALTDEASRSLWASPFRADFDNAESVTGGTFTCPGYRGAGLMAHNLFKRLEYVRQRGILKDRAAVVEGNVPSTVVAAKLGYTVYAKMTYTRVLRWKFWKEKKV